MVKKVVPIKKKLPSKRIIKKPIYKTTPKITKRVGATSTEKILVENFVSLQKVMTNLSIKFDNLSTQISKLLELFEISAKALAEKNYDLENVGKDDRKIAERMDNLLEQNKILARGITLLHEPEQMRQPPMQQFPPRQAPQQSQMQPSLQVPKPLPQTKKSIDAGEYQKSISSKTRPLKE